MFLCYTFASLVLNESDHHINENTHLQVRSLHALLLLSRRHHSVPIGEEDLLVVVMMLVRVGTHRARDMDVSQCPQAAEKLAAFVAKGATRQAVENKVDLNRSLAREHDEMQLIATYRVVQVHHQR